IDRDRRRAPAAGGLSAGSESAAGARPRLRVAGLRAARLVVLDAPPRALGSRWDERAAQPGPALLLSSPLRARGRLADLPGGRWSHQRPAAAPELRPLASGSELDQGGLALGTPEASTDLRR